MNFKLILPIGKEVTLYNKEIGLRNIILPFLFEYSKPLYTKYNKPKVLT